MEAARPSSDITGLPPPASELPWSDQFMMQSIEVLAVALVGGRIVSLKPDCADSFIVGWPAGGKAEKVAIDALDRLSLRPRLLHSTSWRHDGNEVVLTYLAVVTPEYGLPESWEAGAVSRAELARGDAISPPAAIGVQQVLEHALRHLAWLIREDAVVARTVPDWAEVLLDYIPEPFRALGGIDT